MSEKLRGKNPNVNITLAILQKPSVWQLITCPEKSIMQITDLEPHNSKLQKILTSLYKEENQDILRQRVTVDVPCNNIHLSNENSPVIQVDFIHYISARAERAVKWILRPPGMWRWCKNCTRERVHTPFGQSGWEI